MMHRKLVLFLLAAFASRLVHADELRTLGGKTVTGNVTSVSDAEISLATKDGPVATPLSQILALELQPTKGIAPGTKYHAVRLIDETVLYCKEVKFEGKDAHLVLTSDTKLKLPLSAVTYMVRDADNAALKKKFDSLANQRNVRVDRILILRDGELNPLDGTLGDIDAQGKIEFKRDGADPIRVLVDKLHGMIFFRPEGPRESPICKVFDREGNVLSAVKIAFKDKVWQVTTTFGETLPLPEGAVSKLDFNLGKLTYLSDLDPSKLVERSFIGLVNRYRKDTNLDGEPIRLDRGYAKGLSMHAFTEIEFDLAGKFKDFKGTLGIDTRTGADSQPRVTIYCDGEKRFSEVVTAKAVRPVSLSVKDVATLRIVVESRNELDLHDHVTFADARVSQ